MNYTIIGHTEDNSYHDRCGDYVSRPGKFESKFFREENKDAFIKAWAYDSFHNTYETMIILINGIPSDEMTDEEYVQFEALEEEMYEQQKIVKAEHEEAERIRKEAAANAALEKARNIARLERERDMEQFEALKRKLGK